MANIKCDLWCKNQVKGVCNKIEISIDDLQFSNSSHPKCFIFDYKKADCSACEYCELEVGAVGWIGTCLVDGHTVTAKSKCDNEMFYPLILKVSEND